MNKDKQTKENTLKEKEAQVSKLAVFEEDDYFEEFDDEDWNEGQVKEDIDFNKWQEEWEDEEINDQFEKVLRREMDAFKAANTVQNK
jgi:hypothetical protein